MRPNWVQRYSFFLIYAKKNEDLPKISIFNLRIRFYRSIIAFAHEKRAKLQLFSHICKKNLHMSQKSSTFAENLEKQQIWENAAG